MNRCVQTKLTLQSDPAGFNKLSGCTLVSIQQFPHRGTTTQRKQLYTFTVHTARSILTTSLWHHNPEETSPASTIHAVRRIISSLWHFNPEDQRHTIHRNNQPYAASHIAHCKCNPELAVSLYTHFIANIKSRRCIYCQQPRHHRFCTLCSHVISQYCILLHILTVALQPGGSKFIH